tara:strand:+ start:2011 stop:2649 length:639 start_codon:yes stop_codon:yes gene_type:complete
LPFHNSTILEHIASQANRVVGWYSNNKEISVKLVILIPFGDPLKEIIDPKYTVIEGPEDNVLERYMRAVHIFEPDYLVRITGDCAWIPPRIISKHIREAYKKRADYCSNVFIRSYPEGYDCEVISLKLLNWVNANAGNEYDREHVTTAILDQIQNNPDFNRKYNIHSILNEMDLSKFKTSIDTQAEYDTAVENLRSLKYKRDLAALTGTYSA